MKKITLAAARVNAGLTQKEAGKRVGVSAYTIQKWENGKSDPKVSNVRKMLDVYGVDFDDIFFG